jgi:hypothetical protein
VSAPSNSNALSTTAIEQWLVAKPYFFRRIALAKQFRPEAPRFIYKYRSISPDNLQSIRHLRDVLIESKLWLSSPRDFNDPFDMSASVSFEGSAASKRARFKVLIAQHDKDANFKARRVRLEQSMTKPHEEWNSIVANSFEKSVEKVGVISFAGDARNILMWSHYTNHHTGVCLQFEIARDLCAFLGTIPVEYTADYPKLNWIKNSEDDLMKTILKKYEAWGYERERRIVLPDKAYTYLPFSPMALTAIVVGCKASTAVFDLLQSILSERAKKVANAPKIYVARKHPTRYALTIHSHAFEP